MKRYRVGCLTYEGDLKWAVAHYYGEYTTRAEVNEVLHANRFQPHLFVDFLVDWVWYRGTPTSCDPIAWSEN